MTISTVNASKTDIARRKWFQQDIKNSKEKDRFLAFRQGPMRYHFSSEKATGHSTTQSTRRQLKTNYSRRLQYTSGFTWMHLTGIESDRNKQQTWYYAKHTDTTYQEVQQEIAVHLWLQLRAPNRNEGNDDMLLVNLAEHVDPLHPESCIFFQQSARKDIHVQVSNGGSISLTWHTSTRFRLLHPHDYHMQTTCHHTQSTFQGYPPSGLGFLITIKEKKRSAMTRFVHSKSNFSYYNLSLSRFTTPTRWRLLPTAQRRAISGVPLCARGETSFFHPSSSMSRSTSLAGLQSPSKS